MSPTRVFPILDLADPDQQQAYVERFNAAVGACKQIITYVPEEGAAPLPCCFMYVPVQSFMPGIDATALIGVQGVYLEEFAAYMARYHRPLALELSTALAIELYAADSEPAPDPSPRKAAIPA